MSRGKLALTVVAGLLVFLVVLFFYLPASWFASYLPPPARCVELGGSVWSGECLGLSVQDAKVGDATWNLAPLRALGGRLVGDVELRAPLARARADLDVSFSGAGEIRDLTAQFPLDPQFIAQFPADRRGRVSLDLKRVVVSDRALRQLQGTIELRDFRQVTPHALDLGSYLVAFDGVAQPDGKVMGNVKDLGGPFRLEGTLVLIPPNEYTFEGYITGRTADAERLIREVMPYSRPDASGRSEVRFEGSY
jgi:hypothetical protein